MAKGGLGYLWLAGLLEGEGSFGMWRSGREGLRYPQIVLSMTDRDVIEEAALLLNAPVRGPYRNAKRPGHQATYRTRVFSAQAAAWMAILLPYMGERRSAKINKVLAAWREGGNRGTR